MGQKSGTTFVGILVGSGIRHAADLSSMVGRMAFQVHSCLRAFPLRVWMGKDDRAHTQQHIAPVMEESELIEKHGITVDLPSEMPPWDLKGTGDDATLRTRPLETEPGTKKNQKRRRKRAVLVLGILLRPFFMWCYDGATLMSMSGVSRRGGASLAGVQQSKSS